MRGKLGIFSSPQTMGSAYDELATMSNIIYYEGGAENGGMTNNILKEMAGIGEGVIVIVSGLVILNYEEYPVLSFSPDFFNYKSVGLYFGVYPSYVFTIAHVERVGASFDDLAISGNTSDIVACIVQAGNIRCADNTQVDETEFVLDEYFSEGAVSGPFDLSAARTIYQPDKGLIISNYSVSRETPEFIEDNFVSNNYYPTSGNTIVPSELTDMDFAIVASFRIKAKSNGSPL